MKSYYKVHSGPVFKAVKKHLDAHTAANNAIVAWAKKRNLPIEGTSGEAILFKSGYTPDKDSWKKCGKRGGFSPRAKTDSGSVLKSEWDALPKYPSWMHLIQDLIKGREMDLFRINQTGTPGIIKNKGDDFYLLYIDDYWLPKNRDGLEEIKASDYK
jgi:hypothetical protein